MTTPTGAVRVAGDTWFVPGLTNSGYTAGLAVDTGPDADPYNGVAIDTLVITHGHTDHFSAGPAIRESGARVLAARDDARLVENPEVNIRGMFSWARPSDEMVTKLFKGTPCTVDGLVEEWEDPRARAVPLVGHTLGHHGVLTGDRVLFSGDALYQEEIWERHRLPYAIDPALVRASLRHMRGLDFDWLVPGHGALCDRESAERHIDHHVSRLDAIDAYLVESLTDGLTTEQSVALISEFCGLPDNIATYWLAVTTVKGFLGDLLARDEIEFYVRDHAGWWRTKR